MEKIEPHNWIRIRSDHEYAPNKKAIVLDVITGEYTIYRLLLADNSILYAERTDLVLDDEY